MTADRPGPQPEQPQPDHSRPDHPVPAAPLAAWAAERGLVDAGTELAVTRLSGGSSNLTYRVTGGGRDWVLRRPPVHGALPTAHDMGREYRVQDALAGSGVPVARMVALCDDPQVIGASFYLMERLDGVFHTDAASVARLDAGTAREAGLSLARTLAALHRVDPVDAGLGGMVRPEPYMRRQLRRWQGQWDRSGVDEVPAVDGLLKQLAENVPDAGQVGVVHGDYNFGNVMYRADAPGEVRAVLDWELSTVGEPLADLGQLLAYWGPAGRLLNAHRGGHLPDANPALPSAEQLVEAYRETGGAPVRDLAYYERFAVVKLAVICAGALARASGREPERTARTVGLIRDLAAIADS